MCGIFGHIGPISKQLAAHCTDILAHRGPDGSGLWQGEGITLGHRRLSILDLSDQGRQPMSYAGGRYWISYNGEIYNFLEIRTDLEKRGHRFHSESDTEVILAAYTEWREECLLKFNGMWALAIWDDREKTLFLSRDRFGKKPLFYAMLPSGFAFASEMKALFPLLSEVRPNVLLIKDTRRIFQYERSEECLIEGIKRFPAGHYGWWKEGKLALHRWWCTLDHLQEVPSRYEEQVEQFRSLVVDACRLRMRSDVPIGTALSGGLDSSSTISVMAHLGRGEKLRRFSEDWQHAFVACFPGTPLDESHYARMVTDHLGIEATFLSIDPLKAIDHLYDYLYLFEEIYITSPIPFMLTYGAMHKQGVKVTLDGHGSDELFGGYPSNHINALVDAGLNIAKVKMILDTYYDSYPRDSAQFRLLPRGLLWFLWHGRRMAKKVLQHSPKSGVDNTHYHWHKFDALNKTLYSAVHENVLPTLLRNYDRYSMANGVEIRMPFMDHRIVTLAFSLPWTSKIRKGFSKAIVRDAVSPYMPREVAYRKSKIGFNSPIVDWMKGPLKSFFLDIINSGSFKSSDLIDPKLVAEKINQVIKNPNSTFSMGERAWTHISPYLWEQSVIKRKHLTG